MTRVWIIISDHGVYMGASMRSEATAAAEFKVCNNIFELNCVL